MYDGSRWEPGYLCDECDGTGSRALTSETGEQSEPAWSPDFRSIAFVGAVENGSEVFVMDGDGRNVRKITDTRSRVRQPEWSPDGQKLVFVVGSSTQAELHLVDAVGRQQSSPITNDQYEDYDPVFTPDGYSIIYASYQEDGISTLYKVDVNSGNSERFLSREEEGEQSAPSFSRNGERFAYVLTHFDTAGQYAEIYAADRNGDNADPVTTINDAFITSTSWSPEGDTVAYTVSKPKFQQISLVAVGSYEVKTLIPETDNAFDAHWATPETDEIIWDPRDPGATPEPDGLIGHVTTRRLNIRIRPEENAYVVGLAFTNDEVRILARNQSGSWYLVDYGVAGWAFAQNLRTYDDMPQLQAWDMSRALPESQFRLNLSCDGGRGPSFSPGDRFIVPFGDGPTSVYNEPNQIPQPGKVFEGQGGVVVAGPMCTGAQRGNLVWWYVESDSGLKGYMSEGYLSDAVAWMQHE